MERFREVFERIDQELRQELTQKSYLYRLIHHISEPVPDDIR